MKQRRIDRKADSHPSPSAPRLRAASRPITAGLVESLSASFPTQRAAVALGAHLLKPRKRRLNLFLERPLRSVRSRLPGLLLCRRGRHGGWVCTPVRPGFRPLIGLF